MAERLLAWLDDASDRLSPIVIKEIRQTVRGREFNYSFAFSLVVALAVAFFGATSALAGTGRSGATVFTLLTTCLAFLGLAIVPLGAFSALRNERLELTLDLISLTALSSRGIVVGKLLAQGVKLVTLFAVMAPFIAMSFLLGGVDFLTILMSLFVVFLGSLWVSGAALLLSSLFTSRAVSGVLFGGLGLVLFVIFWIGRLAVFAVPGAFGVGGPLASRTGSQIWWALGTLTVFCLATLLNLVLMAENRLSLPTANTVAPLRAGLLVQFLLIVAWALTSIGEPASVQAAAVGVLGVAGGIHLAVVAMFAATEDPLETRNGPRRTTSRSRWSWLLALLSPGGGRGAAYVLVQMSVLLIAAWLLGAGQLEARRVAAAACGYICLFTGLPALIVLWLRPFGATTLHARVAALAVIPASLMLPDVAYFVLWRPETIDLRFSARHLLSPLHTLFNWGAVETRGWQMAPMLFATVGLLAYVALIVIGRRVNEGAQSMVSLRGAEEQGEGGRDGARH